MKNASQKLLVVSIAFNVALGIVAFRQNALIDRNKGLIELSQTQLKPPAADAAADPYSDFATENLRCSDGIVLFAAESYSSGIRQYSYVPLANRPGERAITCSNDSSFYANGVSTSGWDLAQLALGKFLSQSNDKKQ